MTPIPTNTRAKILEVARRLFHEQGYHATGISTILREADVNSGSLYHYFPSKEALLIGVLQYYIELLVPVIMAPAESAATDPIERVFVLLNNYRRGLEMVEHKMGCPIGNLALEVGDDFAEARRLIDQNFRNWAAHIEGWLRPIADRFPPGTDLSKLGHFILTVMEGAVMQARAAASLAPYDDSVAHLRAYLTLLTSDPNRPPSTGASPGNTGPLQTPPGGRPSSKEEGGS